MAKKLVFAFIILISNLLGFSQNPMQDSIARKTPTPYPSKPIDSTFVTYAHFRFDSIFLKPTQVIDTSTFRIPLHEVLYRHNTIYSTLSNTGLAHKSMRFSFLHQVGFDMELPSFSAFMQNEKTMVSYQSVLPYSEINYVMTSGDKEQHLNFKFGRQFSPNLYVSLAINSELSPGVFKNNKSENNYIWFNAHYFTNDKRYGATAYAYRNKLGMQENGGIQKDEDYSSHTESDNSVINTNLNSATNLVKSSGIGFEHYFNLLPQTIRVKTEETVAPKNADSIALSDNLPAVDSIQGEATRIDSLMKNRLTHIDSTIVRHETRTRRFTLGRICHSFVFQRNQLFYNETSPTVAFYQPFDTLLNSSKSTDSTIVQTINNSLKWNSLGYSKYADDIPFYLYAGLNHNVSKVKFYDYLEDKTITFRNYQQLIVNGGIIINLFKSTRITGHAELVTLGYQIGDFDLKGQWKQFLGTSVKNWGYATFDAEIKRQSANWFEQSYYSNHFRWENDFKAATYLDFNLKYNFKSYCIGVRQTSIAQYIYFGADARPAQFDGMFSIREAYLNFYQILGRFELEGFVCVQKASNEEVMHLPLFLGKLRFAYSQPIFRKAATLQPSLTVQYFTEYYADAYMPATRTFYLQDQIKIGNFPFIDLAIAIKVKKANLFLAYSNMFLLTGNYNSFIAPHYPMRDSKIFFGIDWRLFN